mgnify:CR=1 FL=1
MATPTLMDFMSALLTIERYLKAVGEKLKLEHPEQATLVDAILAQLNVSERTLEVVTLVWGELQVVGTGSGPVVHKPEDLA